MKNLNNKTKVPKNREQSLGRSFPLFQMTCNKKGAIYF